MTVPKYIRPVKDPITWPGKFIKKFPGSQYPYEFRCPAPFCFYVIVAPDEETLDKRIEGHTCPWFGGGTTTFSWGLMSDSYIGPIWELLDQKVDIIKGVDTDEAGRYAARQQARGLCEALAVLMVPFFDNSTDIALEASRRHEVRSSGEVPETPGLGRLKWKRPNEEFDPNKPSWLTKQHEDAFVKAQATKPEVVEYRKPEPAKSLPPETVQLIKNSRNFPANMLATAYGVSEAVIQSIWGQ